MYTGSTLSAYFQHAIGCTLRNPRLKPGAFTFDAFSILVSDFRVSGKTAREPKKRACQSMAKLKKVPASQWQKFLCHSHLKWQRLATSVRVHTNPVTF